MISSRWLVEERIRTRSAEDGWSHDQVSPPIAAYCCGRDVPAADRSYASSFNVCLVLLLEELLLRGGHLLLLQLAALEHAIALL